MHLLRDAHKLREAHPANPSVQDWVDQLGAIYREAKEYQQKCSQTKQKHSQMQERKTTPHAVTFGETVFQRRDKRHEFESRLSWLAQPYVEKKSTQQKKDHPQAVLAQRLERFATELFVFIEYPRFLPITMPQNEPSAPV